MVTGRPSLRLATRGSPLARWQADRVAGLLALAGVEVSLVVVETEGDRRTDVPIQALGGQGVFVKEVQAAVARGDADAAVHSAKDLPAAPEAQVPGLVLAAFPERADPRDLLVGARLDTLPTGALVATGSARRRVQLANLRPDLLFCDLRGNLATRLAAVDDVTAVVVAAAGVDRLAWTPPAGVEVDRLEPGVMLPQVGQGALAVECRVDDAGPGRRWGPSTTPPSGGRSRPSGRSWPSWVAGARCRSAPTRWRDPEAGLALTGMVASDDGRIVLRHADRGADPVVLGRAVARYLLDEAGAGGLGAWGPPGDGPGVG